MTKRRILRRFSIEEISGGDSPAQAHARAVIMKREPDVEGKPGFEIGNGGARARLRMLVENQRRGRPALSEADAVAAGWRGLSYADRNALLAEDDDGEDVTFDSEKVDLQKLALLHRVITSPVQPCACAGERASRGRQSRAPS